MDILLDFDGTCVKHAFPAIGEEIGAVPVLLELIMRGHNLILFTMRCDHDFTPESELPEIECIAGDFLSQAVQWFKNNNIPLFGIQEHPTQKQWTSSPKAYGHLIIDDSALGCPIKMGNYERPYADWEAIRGMLVDLKYL